MFLYIYLYVYIYIYTHTHTHTHIYIYKHIYVCAVDMGHFMDVKLEYEHTNKRWLDAKID